MPSSTLCRRRRPPAAQAEGFSTHQESKTMRKGDLVVVFVIVVQQQQPTDPHAHTHTHAALGKNGREGRLLRFRSLLRRCQRMQQQQQQHEKGSLSLALLLAPGDGGHRDARSLHMQGFIFAQMVEDYNEKWDPFFPTQAAQPAAAAAAQCSPLCCCCFYYSCCGCCCFWLSESCWEKYSWTPQQTYRR